eukprot:680100-Alexandrium_andersonii.AAC.1
MCIRDRPKSAQPPPAKEAKPLPTKPAAVPCRTKDARLGKPGFEHITHRTVGGGGAGRGSAPAPEAPQQPAGEAAPTPAGPPRALAPREGQLEQYVRAQGPEASP